MTNTQAQDTGLPLRDPQKTDIDWIRDELENLLFLVERAGLSATARDLRFAIRSAEVELRQRAGAIQRLSEPSLRISRDAGGQGS